MVENRRHPTRPGEETHALSYCQGVRMVHLHALAIHQRDGKGLEWPSMLECADRAVKSVSVHCIPLEIEMFPLCILPTPQRPGNSASVASALATVSLDFA